MSLIKIISSVTSDLVSDQRVHRFCKTLCEMGFEVSAVGRIRKNSSPMSGRPYSCHRLNLYFDKGPLFYMEYNFRLFFYLLRSEAGLLLANDLDTLPANILAGMFKRIPVIYDSHEYFTEVPELIHRPFVRNIWKFIERICVPRVSGAISVSETISKSYEKKYGIGFKTVRNLPESYDLADVKSNPESNIRPDDGRKILIYQGSVNIDRGLEEMVEAMFYLPDFVFYIFGEGDVFQSLKNKTDKLKWKDSVRFMGRMPFEQLPPYTVQAGLGISIENNTGLSYTYCLPNKIFDYIQAGIPVLMSPLPEMISINEKYGFGEFIESRNPERIAQKIREIFNDSARYEKMKGNVIKARRELTWEKESALVKSLFSVYSHQAG